MIVVFILTPSDAPVRNVRTQIAALPSVGQKIAFGTPFQTDRQKWRVTTPPVWFYDDKATNDCLIPYISLTES